MSDHLPNNPIAEQALNLFDFIGENWAAHEGVTDATMIAASLEGLAKAHLASAYEQRTANLIALNEYELKRKAVVVPREELRERLGLGGDK